jgi:hypothetical protein
MTAQWKWFQLVAILKINIRAVYVVSVLSMSHLQILDLVRTSSRK